MHAKNIEFFNGRRAWPNNQDGLAEQMVKRILARVIGCPYGSGFRTDLFPVGPFYITTTFLMGFARTQGACSSLLAVLLFLTSSKGVRT